MESENRFWSRAVVLAEPEQLHMADKRSFVVFRIPISTVQRDPSGANYELRVVTFDLLSDEILLRVHAGAVVEVYGTFECRKWERKDRLDANRLREFTALEVQADRVVLYSKAGEAVVLDGGEEASREPLAGAPAGIGHPDH